MVIKQMAELNLGTLDRMYGLKPFQGFFVKYRNQPYKGTLYYYNETEKTALVSFQERNGEWGNPEECDISDLYLWTEGKTQVRVITPCITLFQCWKSFKCFDCPYKDDN